MKILIVYATNSGGTEEAARIIQDVFQRAGHEVTAQSARVTEPEHFDRYDLYVLGSCTWEQVTPNKRLEGALQEHFRTLAGKLRTRKLTGARCAVYGLGDSSYTFFCSSANHLVALVKQLDGTLVGQALRVDKFFFRLTENRSLIRLWASSLLRELSPDSGNASGS